MQYQIHIASPEVMKDFLPKFNVDEADMTPLPDVDTYVERRRYPFHRMQVGHCFIVPFESNDEFHILRQSNKIRSAVSKASRVNRKFIVKKHTEHKIFEVARIA